MHPLLLLAILVAVLLSVSWYKRLPGSRQKQFAKKALIGAAIAIGAVLLLTGRLNPIVAVLAALVPLAQRVFGMLQIAKTVRDWTNPAGRRPEPGPGKTSEVETRFLRMTLSHDSGAMDGEVLEGRFRGQRLSALPLDALLDLLAECRSQDAQSAAVLEAFLERVHPDTWREREASRPGAGDVRLETMSMEEARKVLGVDAGASREDVITAHRRLMQRLHPDRGGSTYLAAKINQAKDLLLHDLAA